MNPLYFRHLTHALHQPLCHHMQRVEVVAIEAVFQFVDLQIVQSFELHIGIGESLTQLWLIRCQQIDSGLIALGVNNELRIVVACYLGGVCVHETRRGAADKTSNARDTLIFLQHMLYGVGYQFRLCQSLTVRQEYLYGKLVAVGVWEEAYLQRRKNESRQQDEANTATNGKPWVLECPSEHAVIGVLYPIRNSIPTRAYLSRFYNVNFQEWNHRHRQYE